MDLNIRNVPDELHQRLTRKAAALSKTLREYSIDVLEAATDEGVQVKCPMCGLEGPLVAFGVNARCFHCGTGFMRPEGL